MPTHDPTPHEDAREDHARELAFKLEFYGGMPKPTDAGRLIFMQRDPRARKLGEVDIDVVVRFDCAAAYRAYVARASRHPFEILAEFAEAVGSPIDEANLAAAREFFDSMGAGAAGEPTT